MVVDANRLAALQTWESHSSCVIVFSVLFSYEDRTLHYINSQYASFQAEKVNQTVLVTSQNCVTCQKLEICHLC